MFIEKNSANNVNCCCSSSNINMDINIENAFVIFLKFSFRPFKTSFENLALYIQCKGYEFLVWALQRPLLSSIFVTFFMSILLSIITVSLIVVTAVLSAVAMILILEGFILALVLSLSLVISMFSLAILIIISGLKAAYSGKEFSN